MFNLKSLYFRMTIVHYLGIIILPINAFLFTQSIVSQSIQIIIGRIRIYNVLAFTSALTSRPLMAINNFCNLRKTFVI